MKLYDYQEQVVQQVLNEPSRSSLIAAGLGSGKTLMAVEIVKRSELNNNVVLVICPLGTMVSWERTFRTQGLTAPVRRINSKVAGKAAMEDLKKGVEGVYLIGREYFRRFKWHSFKKVGVVVVDEYHVFTNRQSVGHKSLMTLKPEVRLAMSGTPWGNKFENAWAMAKWLWKDKVASRYLDFVSQYAITETLFLGSRTVQKVVGEREAGKFVSDLPCFIRPDLPKHPIVYDQLFSELTPAQRKMYDSFENDQFVWLGDEALVEDLPIVVRIRLREMALGTVELDDEGNVVFTDNMQSSKVDVLKEYLADHPEEPVLILTHSKKYAKIVANRIKDSRLWTGDTSLEDRQTLLEEFGVTFKHLVATISSVAEGIDGLQHNCKTMIWLSRTENNTLNEQVEGRIARPTHGGVKNEVLCIDIIAENTYDESIRDSLYLTRRRNEASMKGLAK